MKKSFLFCLFCCVISISCSFADHLIAYKLVKRISIEELKAIWEKHHIPQFITPIKNAIDVYDIDYATEWHDNSVIKASGLYFVPVLTTPVAQLIYHHGTSVKKERTGMFFNGEETLCFFYAADGYSVIMPDYIGLGRGEKRHLYQHADSEGQSSIDFLAAVNELNTTLKVQTSGQLFLTGYSQGGHATLATQRKIEAEYADTYKITASAPMSGAYDMSGVQSVTMFRPYSEPHYLPYLLESYQEVYKIYPSDFYQIYKEAYREKIKRLYSGKYQHFEINDSLPTIPCDMIEDAVLQAFKTNANFPFKVRLKENDLCKWQPKAPVLMSYSTKDEEVSYKNALVAYQEMRKLGAKNIRKLKVSNKFGHGNTAGFATLQSKLFFDSFRKGSEKGKLGSPFKRSIIRIAKWITPEKKIKAKRKHLAEKKM